MFRSRNSLIALAVGTLFAAAANAQYVSGSGASAQRGTALQEFANTCSGGSVNAQVFQAVSAEGGGNVRAVRCGAAGGKVFSYDSDGGSWRAYAANGDLAAFAAFQAKIAALADPTIRQIRYLDLTLCPAVGGTLASPVACSAGAAKVVQAGNPAGTPSFVSIGFIDENPGFFDGLAGANVGVDRNRPRGFPGWQPLNTVAGSVRAFPSLGVVFGVATSRELYQNLMNDQGITIGNSPGCWNQTVNGVPNLADLTNESCAPTISKDQYRSMANANFGQLNNTYANLFFAAQPASVQTVTLERRDQGSGTQAASNFHFLGIGCTPFFIEPASIISSGGQNVTENLATGDVINRLGNPGTYRIGIVSRENAPANVITGSSAIAGNTGWGFVKLAPDKGGVYQSLPTNAPVGNQTSVQGAYPHQNHALRGLYDFWTVAWTFCKTPVTGDVLTICDKLDSTSGSYSFTPGAGTIRLTDLTTGTAGLSPAQQNNGTYYKKDGMAGACVGAESN